MNSGLGYTNNVIKIYADYRWGREGQNMPTFSIEDIAMATEAILQYDGWKKGFDPEPEKITVKKKSFQLGLKNGVTICMGGDVGVFTHGDNDEGWEDI